VLTDDLKAIPFDLLRPRRAKQEGYVPACLGKSAAKISANGSRS